MKLHRKSRTEVAADQAVALKDRLVPAVETGVHKGAEKAAVAAVVAKEWAAPRAAAAAGATKDWAQPRLEKGWEKTLEAAAPRVEAAADRVTPAVDATRDKLVEDLIPRIVEAVGAAAAAAAAAKIAAEDGAVRTKDRAVAHLPGQAAKRRAARRRKIVLFTVIGAALAAGAAAFARSRRTEDPWTSAGEPTGAPVTVPAATPAPFTPQSDLGSADSLTDTLATSAGAENPEAVVTELPAELVEPDESSVIDLDGEGSNEPGKHRQN